MNSRQLISLARAASIFLAIIVSHAQADGLRTWKDSTGKHEIRAELIAQSDEYVILKTEVGAEKKVAKSKLSQADVEFLKSLSHPSSDATDVSATAEIELIRKMVTDFFNSLRTTDRSVAGGLLTADGQKLVEQKNSALLKLPTPDAGAKSVRLGKITVDATEASVPVVVKSNGDTHRTRLHLSKDANQNWKVFAISAKVGANDNVINFEAAFDPSMGGNKESRKDPLLDLVGKSIELTGRTLDGKPVSLDDFKGRVVLIDFWATWCGPCLREIPNILENYKKYQSAGFEVIGVSIDDDLDQLAEFVKSENPPWTILADEHASNKTSMAQKFGINAIPALILVGADGKVIDVQCRGPLLGEQLAKIFDSK